MDRFVEQARDNPDDKRRNLTRNNLIRVLVEVFLGHVAPHCQMHDVASEEALQEEVVRGLRRYAKGLGNLP